MRDGYSQGNAGVTPASVFWLLLTCNPTSCATLDVPVAQGPQDEWTAIRAFKTRDACWDYYSAMLVTNGVPGVPVSAEGKPLPFDRNGWVYFPGRYKSDRWVECRRIATVEGKRQ